MLEREELQKKYQKNILRIWKKHHIQPSIILEYLYMKQNDEQEALQMLTLEIQRSQIYNNTLSYSNFTDTINQTTQQVLQELKR